MPPEEIVPTTCNHCGKPFNTSRQNPRRYCSISCEEGLAPLPMSDPQSPDYHLFLKGNPIALVGRTLVARGLEFCDYSPDWHKNPDQYNRGTLVTVNEEEQTFVKKSNIVVGKVVDYDGHYTISHTDSETGNAFTRRIKDIFVVEMIRQDRWWVDG
jgi:hypothetical protein